MNEVALANWGAVASKTKHMHNKYRPINHSLLNQIMLYLAYLVLWAPNGRFVNRMVASLIALKFEPLVFFVFSLIFFIVTKIFRPMILRKCVDCLRNFVMTSQSFLKPHVKCA